MYRTRRFCARKDFFAMIALSIALLVPFSRAVEAQSTEHFKMLTSVEYSGKTQFKNQVETLLTVKKQIESNGKVRYSVSSSDFDLLAGGLKSPQQLTSGELSFLIDSKTGHLSGAGKDMALLERINNECVKSLKKVTKDNIGKTWKQSFKMKFLDHLLDGELKFTLTAIRLQTKTSGEMIAVRALSEPFIVKAVKEQGGTGDITSKIGTVYLFDSELENIYISISVFEATTKINGSRENLRHEIATYKTDAVGVSSDLSGLSKSFEKFVGKVGLNRKSLKVVKEGPLPQWAKSEGLAAAQVANICAATACEGALNPVATVYIPATRTVAMQSFGTLPSIGTVGVVSSALSTSVIGIGDMKIAAVPAVLLGMDIWTAGAVGGGAAAIAIGVSARGAGDRSE